MAQGYKIAEAYVDVHADMTSFNNSMRTAGNSVRTTVQNPAAELARHLAAIAASNPTIHINTNINNSVANRQIAQTGSALTSVGGQATTMFAGLGAKVAVLGPLLALAGGAAGAIGPAVATALPAVAALGAGVGVVMLGMEGLKEAFMPLKTEFQGLQGAMGSVLTHGLDPLINGLKANFFPMITEGLGHVAAQVNGVIADFLRWAQSVEGMGAIKTLLDNATTAIAAMRPILGHVGTLFLNLTSAATPGFVTLIGYISDLTGRFSAFIAELNKSGELTTIINLAVDALMRLADAAGQILAALAPVFEALGPVAIILIEKLADVITILSPLLTSIATAFSSILEPALEVVSMIAEGLMPIFETLSPIIETLGAVLGDLILGAFTAMKPAIDLLIEAMVPLIQLIGDQLIVLFTDLAPIIAEVARVFSETLLAVFEALAPVVTALLDALLPLIPVLADAFLDAVIALAPLLPVLATALADILTALIPMIPALVPLVVQFFRLIEAVAPLIILLVEKLTPILTWIAETGFPLLAEGAKHVTDGFKWLVDKVKEVVDWYVKLVARTDAITDALGGLSGTVKFIWDTIKATISGAISAIIIKVAGFAGDVVRKFQEMRTNAVAKIAGFAGDVSSAFSGLKTAASNAVAGMVAAVGSKVGELRGKLSGIKNTVTGAVSGAAGWLVNSGKSIIQGLINGITMMAGRVKSAVGNVLSAARRLLPFSPAKEGPFSGKGWTLYSGKSMSEGLASGILKSGGSVASAVGSVMGGAQNMLGGLNAPTVGMAARGAGAAGMMASNANSAGTTTIGTLVLQVDGHFNFADPGQERMFMQRVRSSLVKLDSETR